MTRILIADDHAIIRKGLKQLILEEYPTAAVGEVFDVKSLLEENLKTGWDLVICDISMPGESGLEALHQIKVINPLIPVLIMSMYPEDKYGLQALKNGASGYLCKNSVHEDLIRAVQTIRTGRKFITPGIIEKLANELEADLQGQPHERLSNREFQVFRLLVSGETISAIAKQLLVSTTTVSTYRARIMSKMNMKSNADIIRYAVEKELI